MIASVSTYGPALSRPAALEIQRVSGPFQTDSGDSQVRNDGRPIGRPGEPAFDERVQPGTETEKTGNSKKPTDAAQSEEPPSTDGEELTESEEKQVRELKQRDTEVRAHEQAHATVGGSYTSPPSYEYTVGPDGKRYATGGEVKIDASPVRDNPKATIRKMEIVIRAALAPAEPSSQDLQVARQAQETRSQAQSEIAKQQQEERKEKKSGDDPSAIKPSTAGSPGTDLARQVADLYNALSQSRVDGDGPNTASLGAILFQSA